MIAHSEAPNYSSFTGRLVLAGLLIAATSCTDESFFCPDNAPGPAILVTVRDARTGKPAARDAVGYVRDDDYVDSLRVWGVTGGHVPITLGAAMGRPGIYDVILNKPGYMQWSKMNVRVRSGHCGPIPVRLNAELEPIDE